MKRPHLIKQLILADFRERTRRYSFLITLGLTLFLGYLVFAGKFTVRLGDYAGYQNSAWTGTTMSMTCTLILVMFGFYLIKNAIRLDRLTGVGEILAATPISRTFYIFGKFVSNTAVLSFMVACLAGSAVVMQLFWGIEGGFNLWDLLSPFIFVTFPAVVFVAGLAVLFESVRWLRGGIGNVVYFFASMMTLPLAEELNSTLFDVWGIKLFENSLHSSLLAAFPAAKQNFILNPEYVPNLIRFPYEGMNWTMAVIEPRFLWIGLALVVLVPAVLFFNRFDPAKDRRRKVKTRSVEKPSSVINKSAFAPRSVVLETLSSRFNFLQLLVAEIRLTIKGYPWVWYIVAGALGIAQLFAPMSIVRGYILPLAWIWPLMIWSSMGAREIRHRTDQLIFAAPRPLGRQLAAIWTTGVLVAVLMGSGTAIRAIMAVDSSFLLAWTTGALFIPSLALALGSISGSSKLFEIIYMVIWYLGPLNHMPALDFAGATDVAVQQGVPMVFMAITLVLIPIAVLARRRQLIF
ncbi:MAG: hypothetical protein GY841_12815 [FCB group bacterium]|nr:hypothetical protein [FCB group bacterium]